MYPLDLLTLPASWLRRTRLWYARGRTWGPVKRPANLSAAANRAAGRAVVSRAPAARAG